MTKTAVGLFVRETGSSFRQDQKVTLASLRMRKHRYSALAAEEAHQHKEKHAHTPRLVPSEQPLRRKFRGPGRHSVWDYMDARIAWILHLSKLGHLDEEFAVDLNAARRLVQILYTICDSTTVYPNISPDGENGISAVWYADRYALEVLVDSDGDATAIVHIDGNISSIKINKTDTAALRAVRGHLGTLSVYVKSRNPHWRKLVAD